MSHRLSDHGRALRTNNRRLRAAMASQLPVAVSVRLGTLATASSDRVDIRNQKPRADHQLVLGYDDSAGTEAYLPERRQHD